MYKLKRADSWQWATAQTGKVHGRTMSEWRLWGVGRWLVVDQNVVKFVRSEGHTFMHGHSYAPCDNHDMPVELPTPVVVYNATDLTMVQIEEHQERGGEWIVVGLCAKPTHRAKLQSRAVAAWEGIQGVQIVPCTEHGEFCSLRSPWPLSSASADRPIRKISGAEMTAEILHCHQARGGTWRCQNELDDDDDWYDHGGFIMSDVCESETWSPCDEHGNFCELRAMGSPEPADWQFRSVDHGRGATIDGLTAGQWAELGVVAWACQYVDESIEVDSTEVNNEFYCSDYRYAPATALPRATPANWPARPEKKAGPVYVVRGSEMTREMFYGHMALGGQWRWWDGDLGRREQDACHASDSYKLEDVCPDETWSPCDEQGHYCDLRRVVASPTQAVAY